MNWTLITGRTRRQGLGLVRGKAGPEYRDETEKVEMSACDMNLIGLKEGDRVLVESRYGFMTGVVRKSDALQSGLVFVPQGPPANKLVGGGTGGTGMPDYKGLSVQIKPA